MLDFTCDNIGIPKNPKNPNLGLTDEEENAIVVFLKTLSDGYTFEN